SLPTEEAARLALRTQQVLAHESGVADTVDPLGGSYYIESLTDHLEAKAQEYIRKIDDIGGAVKAIEQQFYQQAITESAYEYQKTIEHKEKIIVGVNEFILKDAARPSLLSINDNVQTVQCRRLQQLRQRRNNDRVIAALTELKRVAAQTENILPAILNCVEAYSTLGEVSNALRDIWGEYQP
ncbi:MAG TPA: methylmalonyl-CoA mutase family protein, partial [Bacteroidota bacterium]|nr:methylmalonyl-CoA mutase family protein [Bacteroidota bacterium]